MNSFFQENRLEADHGKKSLRGGLASVSARAINAFVQVASILFLARLLTPEDYGVVSMVTALTGFAPLLLDLGTRDAVVQRPNIRESEMSALFWLTFGLGCVFCLIVAASGPLIARFYHEPRLANIALVSSLNFIAAGLTYQHHALLRRAMKFRQIASIEVGSSVIGASSSIVLALFGFGYWALVLRPITTSVLTVAGVWSCCRWLPGKPAFTHGAREMLRFGMHLTGFSFTDFFGKNVDRISIGWANGAKMLGYYQNALMVYDNLLDLCSGPIHSVAVVSLSKLRDNLPELRRLWAKALSTLAFYAMPAFGLLAVTSQDLIVLLLGKKWSVAGVLLSVLALRGIPHVVERSLGWLHTAAGRADRWMRWGLFATCIQVIALFAGLPFGPIGIATAYVVCTYVLVVPTISYAGRPLGIGGVDCVRAVGPQTAGAVCAAGVTFLLRFALPEETLRLARIAILTVSFMTSYLVIVVRLFKVRTPLEVGLSLVRDLVPQRLALLKAKLGRTSPRYSPPAGSA